MILLSPIFLKKYTHQKVWAMDILNENSDQLFCCELNPVISCQQEEPPLINKNIKWCYSEFLYSLSVVSISCSFSSLLDFWYLNYYIAAFMRKPNVLIRCNINQNDRRPLRTLTEIHSLQRTVPFLIGRLKSNT